MPHLQKSTYVQTDVITLELRICVLPGIISSLDHKYVLWVCVWEPFFNFLYPAKSQGGWHYD